MKKDYIFTRKFLVVFAVIGVLTVLFLPAGAQTPVKTSASANAGNKTNINGKASIQKEKDVQFSLKPFFPAPIKKQQSVGTRRHQGIPGIEILPSGRLFAIWYGGELAGEGPGNYVVLATSTDCGRSWREIQVVAPPPEVAASQRAFDSTLWLDPAGRLWWFWGQCVTHKLWDINDGRNGVWASVCDAPDTDSPVWSTPRRIAEGIMLNKPTVLADGTWALPTAFWGTHVPQYADITRPNITISKDNGKNFELVVGPAIPNRGGDEHVLIEQRNKVWRVFVRCRYGIGQAFSNDRGKTWHNIGNTGLGGQETRFALRRLKSGRLLLIYHQSTLMLPGEKRWDKVGRGLQTRDNLTAWLSDDDGRSWYGRMIIDERRDVSYPDFSEGNDGFIYCIYDHDRQGRGEILLARFTEKDVAAGSFVTPGGFSRGIVSAFPAKSRK